MSNKLLSFPWIMYKAASCVKVTPKKPWALHGLTSLMLKLCYQGLWCFRHTYTVVNKLYSWHLLENMLTLFRRCVCSTICPWSLYGALPLILVLILWGGQITSWTGSFTLKFIKLKAFISFIPLHAHLSVSLSLLSSSLSFQAPWSPDGSSAAAATAAFWLAYADRGANQKDRDRNGS